MKLDIKKAIYSPFSDPRWHIKCTIPIILMFCSGLYFHLYNIPYSNLMIINFTLLLPVWFVIAGFYVQFAHNEIHEIKPLLPEWNGNLLKFLKIGAICWGIIFIYFIPMLLIDYPLSRIFYIFCSMMDFNNDYIESSIVIISFLILFCTLISFVSCIYYDDFRFKAIFKIKKIFILMFSVKKEIVIFTIFGSFFLFV